MEIMLCLSVRATIVSSRTGVIIGHELLGIQESNV